jgi:hypothetical protein
MARDGAADVSRPIRFPSSKIALGTAGRRAEKRAFDGAASDGRPPQRRAGRVRSLLSSGNLSGK